MVVVSLLMSAVLGQYFLVMMTLGMHVRTTLISAVYTKVSQSRGDRRDAEGERWGIVRTYED